MMTNDGNDSGDSGEHRLGSEHRIGRRGFMATSAGVGAFLFAGFSGVASADLAGGTVKNFGPQAFKLQHANGAFRDGSLFVVPRYQYEVGEVDVTDNTLVQKTDTTGKVVWGTVAHPNGMVYIGVAGGLDEYDPEANETTKIDIGDFDWVYDTEVAPDGRVWNATMNWGGPGKGFWYDPETGESKNLGPLEDGKDYGYGVTVTEDTAYFAMGAPASIQAVDVETEATTQVLPEEYLDAEKARSISQHGDRLFVWLVRPSGLLVLDTNSYEEVAFLDISCQEVSPPNPDGEGNIVYTEVDGEPYQYNVETDEHGPIGVDHDFPATEFGWSTSTTRRIRGCRWPPPSAAPRGGRGTPKPTPTSGIGRRCGAVGSR